MKKLVFLFIAIASISFACCGYGTSKCESANDTDSVEVVDTLVPDSVVEVATVVAE